MIFEMPPIPFDVHDPSLNKTIHVIASCEPREHSVTLLVSETMFPIAGQVKATITFAFKTDGITIVNICRTKGAIK